MAVLTLWALVRSASAVVIVLVLTVLAGLVVLGVMLDVARYVLDERERERYERQQRRAILRELRRHLDD